MLYFCSEMDKFPAKLLFALQFPEICDKIVKLNVFTGKCFIGA